MAWRQVPLDESGQVFGWQNTDTGEISTTNPQPSASWKDKMGQYPQGTLAIESFGSGAGSGRAIVDANSGQWLTRIGDPGWNDLAALQKAGYTQFANDDGSVGSFQDFATALGQANWEMQTQQATSGGSFLSDLGSIAMPALGFLGGASTLSGLMGAGSLLPGVSELQQFLGLNPQLSSVMQPSIDTGWNTLTSNTAAPLTLAELGPNITGTMMDSPQVVDQAMQPSVDAGWDTLPPEPSPEPSPAPTPLPVPLPAAGPSLNPLDTGGNIPAESGATSPTTLPFGLTSTDLARIGLGTGLGALVAGGVAGLKPPAGTGSALAAQATTLSPNEVGLQDELTKLLKTESTNVQAQQKLSDLLTPALLSQLGLDVTKDANGNITGITKSAPSPEQLALNAQNQKIMDMTLAELQRQADASAANKPLEDALRNREMLALNGQLPVSSATMQDLTLQERELRNSLRYQLGPDYETSSPGMEALALFNRTKESILDSARRGDLTTAQGLMQNLGTQRTSNIQTSLPFQQYGQSELQRIFGDTIAGGQFGIPSIGAGTSLANAFPGTLASLYSNRALGAQVGMQNQNLAAMVQQGNLQGLGQFGGLAMFAPIFGKEQPALAGRLFNSLFGGTNG